MANGAGATSKSPMDESELEMSRASGERSIDVALAEIQLLSHNVYVQRKERALEEEEISVCNCTPPREGDLGCLEDCINRAALIECVPGYCPCGGKCDNQRIQRGLMPDTEVRSAGKKGLGMFLQQDVYAGSFIGEYLGEIVTEDEYHLRRLKYRGEKHRYMMVLQAGEVIDATRCGGMARFINHSCDPNCGVEKWSVNGEDRCGIFALRDICAGEELSFDYKFQSFSQLDLCECLCGASNCRGVIGANNRVIRQPTTQKVRRAKKRAMETPTAQRKKPRVYDPVMPKVYEAVGTKAADALISRMARAAYGQRLLSASDENFIRSTRLLLVRNLRHAVESKFNGLYLAPLYLQEDMMELGDVPPVVRLRELDNFPKKAAPREENARRERVAHYAQKLWNDQGVEEMRSGEATVIQGVLENVVTAIEESYMQTEEEPQVRSNKLLMAQDTVKAKDDVLRAKAEEEEPSSRRLVYSNASRGAFGVELEISDILNSPSVGNLEDVASDNDFSPLEEIVPEGDVCDMPSQMQDQEMTYDSTQLEVLEEPQVYHIRADRHRAPLAMTSDQLADGTDEHAVNREDVGWTLVGSNVAVEPMQFPLSSPSNMTLHPSDLPMSSSVAYESACMQQPSNWASEPVMDVYSAVYQDTLQHVASDATSIGMYAPHAAWSTGRSEETTMTPVAPPLFDAPLLPSTHLAYSLDGPVADHRGSSWQTPSPAPSGDNYIVEL